MILGNGMIARRFSAEYASSDNVAIFASGVADSKQTSDAPFLREEKLLRDFLQSQQTITLVYFSTCSIYDPSQAGTPYILHKRHMERIIKEMAKSYLICRTTNLVGSHGNDHTIVNFLVRNISEGIPFECWKKAERNILDLDDFFLIAKTLIGKLSPEEKSTVNIFNPNFYKVKEMIHSIEHYFAKKALFSEIDKGNPYRIPDSSNILPLYEELGLSFPRNYFTKLLSKYY